MLSVPILIGVIMASIDAIALPIIKHIHSLGLSFSWMAIPIIIYSAQPILFYKALNFTNMTQMNMLWDVSSDILIPIIGLWYFKEKLTSVQTVGIGIGILAIALIGN
jgi:multidrug transporter EmrE-like cation transporter